MSRVSNWLRPGSSAWSFCVGAGSVISLIPGVANPVYETATFVPPEWTDATTIYSTASFVTPEWTDAGAIYGDWCIVGNDLVEAAEQVGDLADVA